MLVIFFGVWAGLFFSSKWTVPLPASWKLKMFDALIVRHRIISSIHGLIATLAGAYYSLYHLDLTCGKENTRLETLIMCNTSAFLLADLIFMIVNGFLDVGNLLHHMLGICGYSAVFLSQRDASYFAFHILPGEISNIQMNMREVFRKIGLRYTKLYFHNEFQYLVIYLIARMFWIPSIYYFMFTCPSAGSVISVLYPIHCVQSFYYCLQMMKLLNQRWTEMNKIYKLGFKMEWFKSLDEKELEKLGIKHYSNFKA